MTKRPRRDIIDFHETWGVCKSGDHEDYHTFKSNPIEKLLAARLDEVAFNAEGSECTLLEFTPLMDSWKRLPRGAQKVSREEGYRQESEI